MHFIYFMYVLYFATDGNHNKNKNERKNTENVSPDDALATLLSVFVFQ